MPGGSGSRAYVLERHERHDLVVEIGKLLHISLTVLLMALLKLSDKALLDGVRTYPPLKLLPVDLVPNLNVCQCGQGGLKLRQKVIGIERRLCQRRRRSLRGRATGYGCSPWSGRQSS
jgi:hypothetical protein